MLEKVIHISKENPESSGQQSLIITVGSMNCSIAIIDNLKNELSSFSFYNHNNEQGWLDELINERPEITSPFQKKRIVFNTPEFILFPSSIYHAETVSSQLETVFGYKISPVVYSESLNNLDIVNVYRIDKSLLELFRNRFLKAEFSHVFSCYFRSNHYSKNSVQVDFTTTEFTIQFWEGGILQLAQLFSYKTPADVIYILLSVFKNFRLSRDSFPLEISGLIEKDSDLYRELFKYFIAISLEKNKSAISLAEPLQSYPDHYFSSVLKIATCE